MWGVPVGLLYSNALEWVIHKYVLHGLGRDRKSFWSFHWHEHHRASRRGAMDDPGYHRPLWGLHAQGREALSLVLGSLVHLPLARRYPWFTLTVVGSQWVYWHVHRKSHLDPAWARAHLPWHVDHHLGPDQHANWCVTWPGMDYLLGTRKPWVGTAAEVQRRAPRPRRGDAPQPPTAPQPD